MDAIDKVVRAKKGSYAVDVEAGKTYLWCSCGRSATQPFCDQSHRGTTFEPVRFVPEESMKIFFCGCKETKVRPICDGTHTTLKGYGNSK